MGEGGYSRRMWAVTVERALALTGGEGGYTAPPLGYGSTKALENDVWDCIGYELQSWCKTFLLPPLPSLKMQETFPRRGSPVYVTTWGWIPGGSWAKGLGGY